MRGARGRTEEDSDVEKALFAGSPNVKYFVSLVGDRVFLYREKNLLWQRIVPGGGEVSLVGVADNGLVVCRSPGEIFLFPVGAEEPPRALKLSRTEPREGGAPSIGSVVVDERGTSLYVERLTEKGGRVTHEILCFEINTAEETLLWKFSGEREERDFLWSLTRDRVYLAVAESQQKPFPQRGKLLKCVLLDLETSKSVFQITASELVLEEVAINQQGVVLLKMRGGPALLGIRHDGSRFSITPPDPPYGIRHFGKTYLALDSFSLRTVTFRSLEDSLLYEVDLKVLDEIGEEFHPVFRSNDDMILIEREDDPRAPLRFTYSTLENFAMEYQRWCNLVQERRTAMEAEAKRKEAEASRSLDEERRWEQKRRELTLSMTGHQFLLEPAEGSGEQRSTRLPAGSDLQVSGPALSTPPQPSPSGGGRERLEKLIEKLDERFIYGEISEATYKELKEKYRRKLEQQDFEL